PEPSTSRGHAICRQSAKRGEAAAFSTACGERRDFACGRRYTHSFMPDDEKPKRTKSWREIDKQRDRGGSSRRSERESERFQSSTKYTQYKTNLERLFSHGVAASALPDQIREKLGAGVEDTEHDEARKKLYAIEDPKAFHAAAT